MDNINIWTTIVDSIGNLLTGIGSIGTFILAWVAVRTSTRVNSINIGKIQPKQYVKVLVFLLLSGVGIWLLNLNSKPRQNQEPLLVFAGGGSVRNYLLESNPKILDIKNSINIAMASGSAWRVLPEEYHCDELGRFNKFNTICLSATKIDTSGNFYKEYISYLEDAIVVEVYLGEDPLVAYVSDSLMKYWGWDEKYEDNDNILLDTLAQRLQMIVEKNEKSISIFSTNKTSGTLEQYKKSFQDLIQDLKYKTSFHLQDSMMLQDSIMKLHLDRKRDKILINRIEKSIKTRSIVDLEKMLDDGLALTYYDKTPSNCIYTRYYSGNSSNSNNYYYHFIILGSKYYKVNEFDADDKKDKITELNIINNQGKTIQKSMYLYFLASNKDSQNADCFLLKDNIIEFLKKIEGKIKNKNDVWDKLMDDKIIEYELPKHSRKIVTVNK